MVEESAVKLVPFDALRFVPRFEYGDMAQLAEICGPADGTALGMGLVRLTNALFDWTVSYDEVLIVLSGQLTVTTAAGAMVAGPHDSIWLPAGTTLTYEAEDCMLVYAIHPASGNPTGLNRGRGVRPCRRSRCCPRTTKQMAGVRSSRRANRMSS